MPNRNYQRGRRLEWQVKKDLEKIGYHVMRTSGSHGEFDLIAYIHPGNITKIRFIQCKVTKNEKAIPRILQEARNKITLPAISETGVIVQPEIIVKIHGITHYTIYPL